MKHSLQRGFTLTELLVTILVIAILAAVALPAFNDMVDRNRISSSALQLEAELSYARVQAVTRNAMVAVSTAGQMNKDWSGDRVVYIELGTTNNQKKIYNENTDSLLRQNSSSATSLKVTSTANTILFNSRGIAAPTQTTSDDDASVVMVVLICSESSSVEGEEVVVDQVGRVRTREAQDGC